MIQKLRRIGEKTPTEQLLDKPGQTRLQSILHPPQTEGGWAFRAAKIQEKGIAGALEAHFRETHPLGKNLIGKILQLQCGQSVVFENPNPHKKKVAQSPKNQKTIACLSTM